MAISNAPSQVATNALQAIPFSSMIGGPLKACIEAQAMAAKSKHSIKYPLCTLRFDCSFALGIYHQTSITMNRLEFEELELQMQQSGLSLKSYLQQAGVSYSTYHYWHKKFSGSKENVRQELASISLKQPASDPSLGEQASQGVALLFPNGLRAHFGNGSEKILMELLTRSLQDSHV